MRWTVVAVASGAVLIGAVVASRLLVGDVEVPAVAAPPTMVVAKPPPAPITAPAPAPEPVPATRAPLA